MKNHPNTKIIAFKKDELTPFATLSGDFNPIHINPNAARDELFGRIIVQGIFAVLRVLDAHIQTNIGIGRCKVKSLHVDFKNPVFPNCTYEAVLHQDANTAKLTLQQADTVMLQIDVETEPDTPKNKNTQIQNALWSPENPFSGDLDATPTHGSLPHKLHSPTFQNLFPNLATALDPATSAELLACSRIVGMLCPGQYSLFSRIQLRQNANPPSQQIQFDRERVDSRFSLVELTMTGAVFSGNIRAFLRPPPIPAPTFQQAQKHIQHQTIFENQQILILGGSSGIGAATALLLAASGANVTITYRHREQQAKDLVREIQKSGGHAKAVQIDITQTSLQDYKPCPDWIFYFATPRIFAPRTHPFDYNALQEFMDYYVDGLSCIAQAFPQSHLFYPSSIALEQPAKGLAEYATAKFAGEQLCHTIQRSNPMRNVWIERLPRIQTGQTLSIAAPPAPDPMSVMKDVLQRMTASNCFQ